MDTGLAIPFGESPRPADEPALIGQAQKGDEAAFSHLYRMHYSAVVGCLYRRTGDAHAAEDLAADAFLAAWKAMPRYRLTDVPLRMWLLRIATNAANRWARQRRRLGLVRVAPPADSRGGQPRAASPALADLERAAALEEAQAALLALRPEHQAAISLHYLESLSIEDVAAVLGCREGTVKSRLSRAREALRRELERRSNRHG